MAFIIQLEMLRENLNEVRIGHLINMDIGFDLFHRTSYNV